MSAPVRACRLVLDLQADSREDLLRTLEDIVCRIDRKEMTTGCSGGYNSGYTHEYTENAGPSHDEYAQQLKDYIAASRPTKVALCGAPVWDEHCCKLPADHKGQHVADEL